MSEKRLRPSDVTEVIATVPSDAVPFVLEPADLKMQPRTPYEAKFSLQFGIAAMIVEGTLDVETFTDTRITDPRLLEMAKRVGYEVKTYTSYPEAFPGGARITTVDGRVHQADLPYQRGSLQNPMQEGDIRRKFQANAAVAVGKDAAQSLESDLLALDSESNVDRVLSQLGAAAVKKPEPLSPSAR
jgi:2-methylcitrate dehydratase PrpD